MTDGAKRLRAAETPSEAILWTALRGRRLAGTKWRRQQKMGRFVVDFYCAEQGLVIEIDGAAHRDRQDLDAERQRMLEQSGVTVVHFSPSDVENRLSVVLDRLNALLSAPSPLVGEGARERRG